MPVISKKKEWLFILLLLLFFVFQFRHLLFALPYGIHEWAQADRLALAYGYYENGMHFFKPSTLSQFSKGGVTGAEFPVQAYLAAGIAKVTGKAYLSLIFRLLDTLITTICLYAMYRIAASFTRHFVFAVLPPLLLLLSPCFLNYTCSYMPDTVSVSLLCAGIGLYLQCWLHQKEKKRYAALLLCTLATLIKTSSAIYLIGFVTYDLYLIFYKKDYRSAVKKYGLYLLFVLLSVAVLIGYFLYNRYVNKMYESSLFLLDIRPITFRQAGFFLFSQFPKVWFKEYFIIPAYLLIAVIFLYNWRYRKQQKGRHTFALLNRILPGVILIVAYLMGSQFIDHDYYIIPVFLPFIVLQAYQFIMASDKWRISRPGQSLIGATILLLLGGSYISTQQRLSWQYKDFSEYYNADWMQNGSDYLRQAAIPEGEWIIALNEPAPNLALVYFDRKGYVLNNERWHSNFGTAYRFFSDKSVQYGVCEQKKFTELLKEDGSFYTYFTPVWQNRQMIIFKLKKTP